MTFWMLSCRQRPSSCQRRARLHGVVCVPIDESTTSARSRKGSLEAELWRSAAADKPSRLRRLALDSLELQRLRPSNMDEPNRADESFARLAAKAQHHSARWCSRIWRVWIRWCVSCRRCSTSMPTNGLSRTLWRARAALLSFSSALAASCGTSGRSMFDINGAVPGIVAAIPSSTNDSITIRCCSHAAKGCLRISWSPSKR